MKEIPSLHPEIEEQINWLSQELSGEDPRLTKKIGKLLDAGVGRAIFRKDTKNPLDKTPIGISLPLGESEDKSVRHVLAFTNGAIMVIEPDKKENAYQHVYTFSPQNKPWESDAWESAGELSRKIRQRPEAYYSKVTHSIFNPEERYEVEELFGEALEKAFVLKENEIDGLREGTRFLNDALTVFESKKDKKK